MPNINFPFSAIVEQNQLKTALLLCAIDPSLGGVLISGDKGTAKSTAARALADILPPIERIIGCAYNCPPGQPSSHCTICNDDKACAQATSVPFVTLPLGATEDSVLGTLDIERALKGAERAFQAGLLAAAHRGILYIDEVNLLPDHLVDVLLDVAAMGVNSVQREGLSVTHPARFTLIGTMNLEEGNLRPQLLDRFGLMVEVVAPQEKLLRADVVRRRIAFEADPAGYVSAWEQQQNTLREQLINAQQRFPKVILDDTLLELVSHLCCEFEVTSLRADIIIHKASRALAALDNRAQVTQNDIKNAAELVLPHRRRRKPFEQPGMDQEQLDDLIKQSCQTATVPESESVNDHSNSKSQNEPQNINQPVTAESEKFTATSTESLRQITVEQTSTSKTAGQRSVGMPNTHGRIIRSVANENPESLAIGATLRTAVTRNSSDFQVKRQDLHQHTRETKTANLIILVVDASGSMAAQRRMESVKGAVLALLTDAYQRRDQVAVIAFRGFEATTLLGPTRSVDLAEQNLRELETGGRTPLPHALQLTIDLLEKNNGSNSMQPLVVLLSDGKANVAVHVDEDPWQESLTMAGMLLEQNIPALVIDTETGYLRLGRANQLALALGGDCLSLEELTAENLTLTIRECIRKTS